MGTTSIRRAIPGDLPALGVMMEDFYAIERMPWIPEAALPAARELLARDDLGLVGVLVEAGADVGYFVLTWGFDLEFHGRDAFLTELYFVPSARGRGLARDALPRIEALAAAHDARALHLMARPENPAAMALYTRAGYTSPPRVFLSKELVPKPTTP